MLIFSTYLASKVGFKVQPSLHLDISYLLPRCTTSATLGVEYGDLRKLRLPQDESLELCYETPSVRFSATYLVLATRLLLAELHLNLKNRIPLDFVFSGILWANVPNSLAGYCLPFADFIPPPFSRSCSLG